MNPSGFLPLELDQNMVSENTNTGAASEENIRKYRSAQQSRVALRGRFQIAGWNSDSDALDGIERKLRRKGARQ